MSRDELREFYREREQRFRAIHGRLIVQSRRVAIARAAVFIALAALAIRFATSAPLLGIAVPIILLVIFLYLVRLSVRLGDEIKFTEQLIRVQAEETRAIGFDFSAFPEGSEFNDYHHAYAWDLDLFGKHSIYRMLVRAGTDRGHRILAEELLGAAPDPALIRQRQEAIRELADKADWRHRFLARARMVDESDRHAGMLEAWLKAPDRYHGKPIYRLILILVPLFSFALLLLFLLPLFPYLSALLPSCPPALLLYYLLPLSLVLFESKAITSEHNRVSQLLRLFKKYQELLGMIEKESYGAPHLAAMQEKLTHEGVAASAITRKLAKIVWGLEARMNLIMAFVLNACVIWDIRYMMKLERWRAAHGAEFTRWLSVIGQFESLSGLANFAFNRSDCTFPTVSEGPFALNMQGAGHPLLDPDRRVDNDLELLGEGQVYLVTGANMAGTSTLLRTAGVNLLLAMLGAPVCAKKMTFTPVHIRTSVRTNDSLGDDESYFYAELKKLSAIIHDLTSQKKLFVIVDEMLRGTNSRDKHTGSEALIRRLIELGASGLVATHDVELGSLADRYPERVHPHCFEVSIESNQLHFDYLLRPGISRSLNATFLMKQMGIIID